MVNRRMGNRSITSLRSRRRQTTVSHSRAGLNTDSRNPCRTASRSNTGDLRRKLAEETRKNGITKTALIVVGDFLGENYERSKLYDPAFTTEFRKGTDQ